MLRERIIRLLMAMGVGAFVLLYYTAGAQVNAAAPADTDSAAYWKKVIESAPGNQEAHEKFIKETGLKDESLIPQYEAWMKKFPTEAAIPLAIGTALYNRESPQATAFLKRTVAIDPKQAQVYLMLAIDAERWGDGAASREYMRKAAETAPDDPSYAFYYAMDFEHIDPAQWRTKLYELAKKFPESERGAQGLYWLATRSTDPAEKLRVYELLRSAYSPLKFNWSISGMSALYDIYLEKDPQKALELAKALSSKQGWAAKDTLAQNVIAVRALLAKGKAAEAAARTEKIKVPRYSGAGNMIALLSAEAKDAAGDTKAAYNSLVALFAREPADELQAGIDKYGKKLGMSKAQAEADVWKIRDAATRSAPPFNLGLYTSSDTASLDDYKGKVVLLTFWFPGCGPCRGEFPHFEAVVKKFNPKEVAYLGINVLPEQDEYVLPFMKGTGYSFTPLRGTSEWAEKVYKVRGEPTNFLIDQQGRIVFSNFRTDANNHRELELMISSLLKRS